MELTLLEFAAIMTIHQEPNYRFVSNERQLAKRMVNKGYLQEDIKIPGRYLVTATGERAYASHP